MKALVYTKPGEIVYRQEPDPQVAPGETLIKVEAVGICGSDMHAYHGYDPRRVPPLILGHEVVGTVLSGETKTKRAVINPLITCSSCEFCISGRTNLCTHRELIGMRRAGAFAEYITVPEKNLIYISDKTNAIHAALAEPCATAIHALNLAENRSDCPLSDLKVLVIGGGAIGVLSALILHSYGNHQIVLSEPNKSRRDSAKSSVYCKVHDPFNDKDLKEDGFDLVVDAVGGAVTRDTALKVVKPGGIILHIGLMDDKGDLDIRKLTLSEITLIGVYTYTPADIKSAVKMLQTNQLGELNWIEIRSLSDGSGAFEDLDHGRTSAAKIILRPDL